MLIHSITKSYKFSTVFKILFKSQALTQTQCKVKHSSSYILSNKFHYTIVKINKNSQIPKNLSLNYVQAQTKVKCSSIPWLRKFNELEENLNKNTIIILKDEPPSDDHEEPCDDLAERLISSSSSSIYSPGWDDAERRDWVYGFDSGHESFEVQITKKSKLITFKNPYTSLFKIHTQLL